MTPTAYLALFLALALGVSIGHWIRGRIDRVCHEKYQLCPVCLVPTDMVKDLYFRNTPDGICSECGQKDPSFEA